MIDDIDEEEREREETREVVGWSSDESGMGKLG